MEDAIRGALLDRHGSTTRAVIDVADEVAATVATPADRRTVEEAMEDGLRAAGVWEQFVPVIEDVVATADAEVLATPVAASPYVLPTGRGPLLRVTVEGARIVVCFAVFELAASGTGYVRRGRTPADVVRVDVVDV